VLSQPHRCVDQVLTGYGPITCTVRASALTLLGLQCSSSTIVGAVLPAAAIAKHRSGSVLPLAARGSDTEAHRSLHTFCSLKLGPRRAAGGVPVAAWVGSCSDRQTMSAQSDRLKGSTVKDRISSFPFPLSHSDSPADDQNGPLACQ
jgi:hypothetical protein